MENLKSIVQIVLWIGIPAIVLSGIITAILHYRRKKTASESSFSELLEIEPSVDLKNSAAEAPSAVELEKIKENKNMIKHYTAEIEKNREIIAHLKSEFSFLETKYEELKASQGSKADHITPGAVDAELNNKLREADDNIALLNSKLSQYRAKDSDYAKTIELLNNEIALLKNKNAEQADISNKAAENTELEARLKESENRIVALQNEMEHKLNLQGQEFLQLKSEKEKLFAETIELKQQTMQSAIPVAMPDDGPTKEEYENLLKEKEELAKKISEYSYFEDLINEKKQQIAFLEKQVEQRVKQVHETEQNYNAELKKAEIYAAQIAGLKREYDNTNSKLAEQNRIYNNQILELESLTNEFQTQKNVLHEKQHFISSLENNLKSEKESSESLKQVIVADKNDISQLTKQTEEQYKKIEDLEGKLKITSQLLARIYSDLGKSFASIFSEELNVLPPESVNMKEINARFTDAPEAEVISQTASSSYGDPVMNGNGSYQHK
jgi:chromosome segregation ATPase